MRILLSVALFLLALSGCGKSQPTDTDTTSATADVSASTNKTPKSAGISSPNDDKAPALKEAFADAFLVGTALNRAHIYGEDQQGIALIKRHFNSITAENISKWEHIHPEPMVYAFEPTDRFVEFGERHGMYMIGHALVWHSQTPGWVFENENGQPADRDALLRRMKDHIQTVVGRYKGRIQAWDVVNEALDEDGSLRKSPWYNIIGEEYVELAFQYAHEADPGAALYYNDYSLESPAKRAGAIRLIKSLRAKGIPVAAVGTQGHFGLDWPSLEELEKTITEFAALDVDVMFTEMEIDVLPTIDNYHGAEISTRGEWDPKLDPYRDGFPAEMQQKLAERYRELFKVFLDHRDAVTRVTFWGVTDADSWKNNWPVPGRTNYPLLFDRDGQPKPAFYSVVDLTREALGK